MKYTKSPRSGFTLIELLTVIAIIGILAAIIIPTVGNVQTKAAQVTSSSNMKQIAVAYATYSNSGTRTRTIKNSGAWSAEENRQAADQKDWATLLAYHAGLTDAGIWFIASDTDVEDADVLPRSIGVRTGNEWNNDTDWGNLAAATISYTVVVNMSSRAPSNTPLLWTKGLGTDGIWVNTSPWGGQGGHIAFMDGRTEWFEDIAQDDNKLAPGSASGLSDSTENIQLAIRTRADTTTFPAIGSE